MPKPSDVVELVGFGFLALAAFHSFGVGAGEAVVGVECIVFSLSIDGVKLKLPKVPDLRFWRRKK